MADEIRAVLAEVARLDREMVELRGKGDAGCIGNALRLAHKAPRLAAALAVAVEQIGAMSVCPCVMEDDIDHCPRCNDTSEIPHPALARIAAALTEEAPL